MSKDIWHTKDEIPRQESRVLWKSGNVVCGGRFDTHYKCFCGPASQFVDLRNVSRWCYVDDLIKENECTRKALDVAVDALKSAHDYYQNCVIREKQPQEINWYCTAMNIDNDIFKSLEQITALEQKDGK